MDSGKVIWGQMKNVTPLLQDLWLLNLSGWWFKETPSTKSHYSLVTWSYVVTWQIWNVTSIILQDLWPPIWNGRWLMTWGYQLQNQTNLSKNLFLFMYFLSTRQCIFTLIKSKHLCSYIKFFLLVRKWEFTI